MKPSDLNQEEFNPYYTPYINKVPDIGIIQNLEIEGAKTIAFFKNIPSDKIEYRYAEEKWNSKEMLQHIIDTERIFSYRALRISRMDKTPLAGYSENDYAANSDASKRDLNDLIEEYQSVRNATISLFKSFNNKMLLEIGNANGSPMSPRAIACIIIGHEIHHCGVFRERYLFIRDS